MGGWLFSWSQPRQQAQKPASEAMLPGGPKVAVAKPQPNVDALPPPQPQALAPAQLDLAMFANVVTELQATRQEMRQQQAENERMRQRLAMLEDLAQHRNPQPIEQQSHLQPQPQPQLQPQPQPLQPQPQPQPQQQPLVQQQQPRRECLVAGPPVRQGVDAIGGPPEDLYAKLRVGQHIAVKRRVGGLDLTHHAVVVAVSSTGDAAVDAKETRVVHYVPAPLWWMGKSIIDETTFAVFLYSSPLEDVIIIAEPSKYTSQETAERARNQITPEVVDVPVPLWKRPYTAIKSTARITGSLLGLTGYNLLFSNCEHFATWCLTDKRESAQARRVMKEAFYYVGSFIAHSGIGYLRSRSWLAWMVAALALGGVMYFLAQLTCRKFDYASYLSSLGCSLSPVGLGPMVAWGAVTDGVHWILTKCVGEAVPAGVFFQTNYRCSRLDDSGQPDTGVSVTPTIDLTAALTAMFGAAGPVNAPPANFDGHTLNDVHPDVVSLLSKLIYMFA